MRRFLRHFRGETATGALLFLAAILAMIAANSPASRLYESLLGTPVEVRIGAFAIAKPLLLWINDGLMAVFVLLVGLELKRELIGGKLSKFEHALLPLLAAVGGIAGPALIYTLINHDDPIAMKGWAIPAATDIAFSLGVLAVLSHRVPVALKVFLVSLATIDDVGAIVIIAAFYTSDLGTTALALTVPVLVALFVLNRCGVAKKAPYLVLGVILWALVLKSGVHATLAGVVLAFFVPLSSKRDGGCSPGRELEHDLHHTVAFGILPVFAFANAGVSMAGLAPSDALRGVPFGIAAGLLLGKPLGIFSISYFAVRWRIARLPDGVTLPMLFGVSLLCGIGFTMSLFIGSLAFEQGGSDLIDDRIGILLGSILSGIAGYATLRFVTRRAPDPEAAGTDDRPATTPASA